MSIFLLVLIVIEGLVIWGSKCHQNNFPVVCDGYVKYMYEEADCEKLIDQLSCQFSEIIRNKRPEVQCHPQHNLGSEFWRLQIIKKVDLWRPFQI